MSEEKGKKKKQNTDLELRNLISKRKKHEPTTCQISDDFVIQFNSLGMMHCLRAGIIPKELASYVLHKIPPETQKKIDEGDLDGTWESYDAMRDIACAISVKPKLIAKPSEECDPEKFEMSWDDLSDQEMIRIFSFIQVKVSGGDLKIFKPFRDEQGCLVPLSDVPRIRAEAKQNARTVELEQPDEIGDRRGSIH